MIPWLTQRAAATRGATALEVGDDVVSFAELATSVHDTALRLRAAGVREGDVLATLLWNGRAFVEALHAAISCGAALLPLNARATAAELAFVLRDASVRLVIHGAGQLAALAHDATRRAGGVACAEAAVDPAATLACVQDAGCAEGLATGGVARCETTAGAGHAAAREAGAPLLVSTDPERILAIVYTSGTTGRPRGALLALRSLLASAAASALHLGASASDRWLACLPLFHVGGLAILVRSVLTGSAVVLHERFDARAVCAALDERAITHVSLVPTMLSRVLDAWGDRSAPSTLSCVLVGGAAAPLGLLDRARRLGFPVAPTYGLTEAASQVATLPPGAAVEGDRAAGWPLPGVEIRIVSEAGTVLAAGEAGEICVRGATLMAGYLGLPEASAKALRGGWLHTGDIGVLGADGALRVLDRRSDLVVSGGENVYPAEVEAILAAHPGVAEAAVAGEPDPDLGQRVVAGVVLREGARTDAEALRAHCRAHLAGYKVPRRIALLDELPRTSSGKLLRRAIVSELGAGLA
ncbi:MAG: o-succinylbenzoate--CoA ligase [Deltaproteobacteria bacterium]|nr:o-succinylbenzoate--CoA ligase [Deltaproteobacteria bacterium]